MRWLALSLLLAGCGPTCEERGGKYVQDGYIYVPYIMNNIAYVLPHPYYTCVIKDKI